MKQLILDANILLDFYRFGKDDLEEIQKLLVLIADGDVALYSNDQLQAEVARNREKVLSETLKAFKSQPFSVQAPNFCKSFSELNDLNDVLREAYKKHEKLIQVITEKINNKKLQADIIINGIFKRSKNIDTGENIISLARRRVDCGNPPGKKGSLGDAIHWECLLSSSDIKRLNIASRDSDFASELDRKKPHSFLIDEWSKSKGSFCNLSIFPSLSDYFKAEFPQIRLSDEIKKFGLIDQLESSPNFAATHDIIAELSKFDFFTVRQTQRLFGALVNNSQVGWIGTDEDINIFYRSLQHKAWHVSDALQDKIQKLLEVEQDFFNPF